MAGNRKILTIISKWGSSSADEKTKKILSSKDIEFIDAISGDIDALVIEAQGKWTVIIEKKYDFTELETVINTSRQNHSALVIVGINNARFEDFVGIRNLTKTLPILFNTDFLRQKLPVSNVSGHLDGKKIVHTLKDLDKNGGLLIDENYLSVNGYFDHKTIIIRPYFSMFRNMIVKNKSSTENYDNSFVLGKNAKNLKFNNDIPIFINCRDRLDPLLELLNWLGREKMNNIFLVDNDSSYEPLLKFYSSTQHKVIKLSHNYGHRAPWISGAINVYAKGTPYIVTDPDIIPEKTSHGAIKNFVNLLNKYPDYYKAGFGLRIDNLPKSYKSRDSVIKWESQFWVKKIEKDVFVADIDTTFALYRPGSIYAVRPALRTGGKFLAEHEPWYQDSEKPSPEYAYYLKNARREIASWGLDNKNSSKVYGQ